ncbi:MAG: fibro-slime domain-containing protein [Phycisphaerales bacterium]|nr:fibro-slime domain-containing protein [Phycisphaerales bacterium]
MNGKLKSMLAQKVHAQHTALALAGVIAAIMLTVSRPTSALASPDPTPPAPPPSISLTGSVRDFKERTVQNGHPDFEITPAHGYGLYCGALSADLGSDGNPVFLGQGFKVKSGSTNQWRNSASKNICWRLYDPARGDLIGKKDGTYIDNGGITNGASFDTWFRDMPGTNLSAPLTLVLNRTSDGSYVFDSTIDPQCVSTGGFFPIEGQLFGNPGGTPNRNFHFTFELHTEFTYDSDGAQIFIFRGDDDVWVYVNDRMVIDLGGVHSAVEQRVELNRLGLTDGETYKLDFFFAERHRTQSNFRIQTNLLLHTASVPSVTSAFD